MVRYSQIDMTAERDCDLGTYVVTRALRNVIQVVHTGFFFLLGRFASLIDSLNITQPYQNPGYLPIYLNPDIPPDCLLIQLSTSMQKSTRLPTATCNVPLPAYLYPTLPLSPF